MNNKKSNDIGGLIGQRLKNNKQKSHNRYNYSFGKNSNLNNTINYNPVTKMNIGIIDHDDDDSNIEIDNEEKILKTDDHADFSQNNGDMERNYNTDYADITPTKKKTMKVIILIILIQLIQVHLNLLQVISSLKTILRNIIIKMV